jgi:hypothetical protein
MAWKTRLLLPDWAKISVFATIFRPALGPTQPSIQQISGAGSMVLTLGVRMTKCQGKEHVELSLHSPICNYDVRCLNFSGHVLHYCNSTCTWPIWLQFLNTNALNLLKSDVKKYKNKGINSNC